LIRAAASLAFVSLVAISAPALSQDTGQMPVSMTATVKAGDKVNIGHIGGYNPVDCTSGGPPIFKLTSTPKLGTVTEAGAPYVVPQGESCAGKTFPGLDVFYAAGAKTGLDEFTYTIEPQHVHKAKSYEPVDIPKDGQASITVVAPSGAVPSPSPS
jgi:hypothetical protein